MELYEIPNISIWQIQIFLSVVHTGGFARAGLAMHITQPAVSKNIAKIEKELDIKLFVRNTRNIILTEEGQRLYNLWDEQMTKLTSLLSTLKSSQHVEENTIKIAITNTTLPGKYLWDYVEAFSHKYPEVKFSFDSDSMHIIIAKLLDDEYDIAIVPDFQRPIVEKNNLQWEYVKRDSVKALIHDSNPLSKKDFVTMEELLDEDFVTLNETTSPNYVMFMNALFEPYGRRPNITTIYRSDDAIKSIYRGLDGIFLTDDYFDYDQTADIRKVSIKGHSNGLIGAHKKKPRNEYVAKFVKFFEAF